ncbi:MAG: biotin/lipoyl-binding protein, partial [Anaerolineae bacterium]
IAISPKVSGHIANVYIADNQDVNKGDALFDIDERDYVVRLDLARAELEEAKAQALQAQKDFERYEKLKTTGDRLNYLPRSPELHLTNRWS